MSFLLATTLLLSYLSHPTHAYTLHGYWGANLAQNQYPSSPTSPSAYTEPSLATICTSTPYTHIHLSYMKLHFDVLNNSALDLDAHCRWPTNKWAGYPDPVKGFNVLDCGNVGLDVEVCHAAGKKVILSISPMDYLLTATRAEASARNVWNLFLGGTSSYRPFGNVVLDGVEVRAWNNDPNPELYVVFLRTLRELMDGSGRSGWVISGAVSCIYPDYLLGPNTLNNTLLSLLPTAFTHLTISMLSNPATCGYSSNTAGFYSHLTAWATFLTAASPNTSLVVTLPSWYTPEWVNGATGDYVRLQSVYEAGFWERVKAVGGFGGLAMQDVSFDVLNRPCSGNDSITYSGVLWGLLNGVGGNGTRCAETTNVSPFGGGVSGASSTAATRKAAATSTLKVEPITSDGGEALGQMWQVVLPILVVPIVGLLLRG
ncbi:glycoside hydrolase superfamily [Fimicolochytrium jonesii]|uniref:glycoside hydrolase superfamily n=1 Tax=Fimicolochytrium jonesii TaxID=1396493 RepID=UPI0022FDC72A|nr:glycoside hydrolase superfamily [Fimicolochytrium jonesii]KAI8823968.1 glycoside hydrolase superfamily [Fimicolochytrium jonesii]